MKASIEITNTGYGFGKNWTLVLESSDKRKSFFLGQDVKVCQRLIGMSAAQVCLYIGGREIESSDKLNSKLANLILEIVAEDWDLEDFMQLQDWDLAVQ